MLSSPSDHDPSRESKKVMKSYSRKVLSKQLMTTFMLLARATSRQVRTSCQHLNFFEFHIITFAWPNYYGGYYCLKLWRGVCIIHMCVEIPLWRQVRYQERIQSGHHNIIYDNVNLLMRVRHKRSGNQWDCTK